MPYTAPHTITTGELVTVDTMNDEWGGNASFLANPPSCRVYHNANISIAENSIVVLGVTAGATAAFNQERWDTDGMHSTVTNPGRITFNTAGVYVCTFNVVFENAAYNYAQAAIMLNNSTALGIQDAASFTNALAFEQSVTVTVQWKFQAGDYIVARVYHRNAAVAARNVIARAQDSLEFSATWIGLG